ncbi:penicillin acylase family protein [Mucilaginibacter aquatilis]|uniref:Penicillin acylase family protein n=1 Tax=Mucilaginibacter aquatilis TaxID=1517760 RepID=A0A6I4I5X9_9SPHI|nr:penicillin acylase family protein [Mucilaginibacter aquatilis]MVN89548.1 penicillin acylase family protein [Mucilaginibacter aquatilis]
MKILRAVFSMALLAVLIWALQTKFGPVPPIGKFINPATGFWQNAESKNIRKEESLELTGLYDKVIIRYDENRVPHIFAKNDHDLYMAQGYVTATDRLWQMDIQTRNAAGRLAEVIGPSVLEVDRYNRRTGMVYGAEEALKGIKKDSRTKLAVEAYSAGINQFINNLTIRNYPVEFKLLDYKPETWTTLNTALLLKLMSQTLAGGSDDMEMTAVLNKFGAAVTRDLFPDQNYQEDPIIPSGTRWNFTPLKIPQPSSGFKRMMQTGAMRPKAKTEGIGSNNWAVAGSKSATGYPLLANDPHLNLTFPSIWYQVQLHAPGVNVQGVSLPGSPFVIIGYNSQTSWGFTNVDADVLDWYQLKFKDNAKTEYWYKNQWNKTTRRKEVIKVRGQSDITEQVIYTHFGPVVYDEGTKAPTIINKVPAGMAMKWIAHKQSNDLLTFYLLNRGKNYGDYRKALSTYSAPAQNFIFASNTDIAITPNGEFPLKYPGQGKFILDGTDPDDDWHERVPANQNPTVKNPARGFVSSANQSPTDKTYPYYLNWQFGGYQRGKRINDRLTAMSKITVDSMRLLQTDNYSVTAHDVLPTLLSYLDSTKLDGTQKSALRSVSRWNLQYDAKSVGATIFNNWWNSLYNLIWQDEFDTPDKALRRPSRDRTIQLLLTQPNAKWFDDVRTPTVESCADLVSRAFNVTVDELTKKYGTPGERWAWGTVRPVAINHIAKLPGFGSDMFASGGNSGIINAMSGEAGPSWRMVVQMGPEVKGYGIYPGGQSGNPGSFYYTNLLQTWKDGKLNELLLLKSPTDKEDKVKSTLILNKK